MIRAHDILYFSGFFFYVLAMGIIIFGISLFFTPEQVTQNPYPSSNDAILLAFIYGSRMYIVFSGFAVLISGALMVAFADLVRSNMYSDETLFTIAKALQAPVSEQHDHDTNV